MSDPYIKGWKLRKGYPHDAESIREINKIKEMHGNGWWWFRTEGDREKSESSQPQRDKRYKYTTMPKYVLRDKKGRFSDRW